MVSTELLWIYSKMCAYKNTSVNGIRYNCFTSSLILGMNPGVAFHGMKANHTKCLCTSHLYPPAPGDIAGPKCRDLTFDKSRQCCRCAGVSIPAKIPIYAIFLQQGGSSACTFAETDQLLFHCLDEHASWNRKYDCKTPNTVLLI